MTMTVMIQGTGSNVGKSLLVAGLCRALTRRGMKVRPFKPQNMSNNAAVTADGGEIGRAQALQALACGVETTVDMNPVLLKPETDVGAQVILLGERLKTVKAREYGALKNTLLPDVTAAFARLKSECDIVIVEGAGSPAETNLRAGDIANMGFAAHARVPVILAGDIDRGGVIAQMVGTCAVLTEEDRALIKAFLINKFRGDTTLFEDGLTTIANQTGWPSLGIVPHFSDANLLPAEDALDIQSGGSGSIKIAVPLLSRIANFDDFDPLKSEPDVCLEMVKPGSPIPRDADVIILPGTKSTIGDLKFLRAQGWDIDIHAHARQGGKILGICGGYQMLGRKISDPHGIEGASETVEGLGLLDVETLMTPEKTLSNVVGTHLQTKAPIVGYEIHIGETRGPDCEHPYLNIAGSAHGAQNGVVGGCYIHGLFSSDAFRTAFLQGLNAKSKGQNYSLLVQQTLDNLADHLETHLDIDQVLSIAKAGV